MENIDYLKIGSRIREIRIKKGLSQAMLAEAANISLPHISYIELGKTKMQLSTFVRLLPNRDRHDSARRQGNESGFPRKESRR